MGDFNAKIGTKKKEDINCMGNFRTGDRNTRGDTYQLCRRTQIYYCQHNVQESKEPILDLGKPKQGNTQSDRLHFSL